MLITDSYEFVTKGDPTPYALFCSKEHAGYYFLFEREGDTGMCHGEESCNWVSKPRFSAQTRLKFNLVSWNLQAHSPNEQAVATSSIASEGCDFDLGRIACEDSWTFIDADIVEKYHGTWKQGGIGSIALEHCSMYASGWDRSRWKTGEDLKDVFISAMTENEARMHFSEDAWSTRWDELNKARDLIFFNLS